MRASSSARLIRGGRRAEAGPPHQRRVAAIVALAIAAATARAGAQDGFEKAEPFFRFPVGGLVSAGPTVAGGLCWILSDSKTLYALTTEGKAIGKRSVLRRASAFLVGDAYGRAALSDGETGVAVVNRAGSEVWKAELGSPIVGRPAFASDGRLYVVAGTSLSAFAPAGRRLWRVELGSAPSAEPVVGPGGGPALGLAGGALVLYSPGGARLAAAALGAEILRLSASPDRLAAALADGRLVVLARGGDAGLVQASRGSVGGATPTGAPLTGEPAIAEPARLPSKPAALASSPDGFYALGADGTLLAVDPDGRRKWELKLPALRGPVAVSAFAGKVVVLSKDSARSFGADGSPYRTLRLERAATPPAIAPNGAVFAGGEDWILYAYRFERPLEPGAEPRVAAVGFEAMDAAAAEYAAWTPFASDEATVTSRLADIEKSLKSGTIPSGEPGTLAFLSAVALGRIGAPFGVGAVGPGPTPGGAMPRAYACGLLGATGLAGAVPFLVRVFEEDGDPSVRAAAAAAVAMVGLDPEGDALGAFSRAADAGVDGTVAGAIVDAIEALYAASGALDDRAGVLALVRIAGGAYPRDVRARAEKALSRVVKGGK